MQQSGRVWAAAWAIGVSFLFLHGASARADEVVKYRRPDGSIGFAQDRSSVPKDAAIVSSRELGPSAPASPGPAPAAPAARAPARPKPSAAQLESTETGAARPERPQTAGAADDDAEVGVRPPPSAGEDEDSRSLVDEYKAERARLRKESEKAAQDAEKVHCEGRTSDHGRNCNDREEALKKAEETLKENERRREEILEQCKDSDDCEPRVLLDD